MKGFPNSIADVNKLTTGMRCIADLIEEGQNPRDDGVLGQKLIYTGIIGPRDKSIPADEYIKRQLTEPIDRQSFRTSARLLKEFYGLLGFIVVGDHQIEITDLGHRIAGFADGPMNVEQIEVWRMALRNFTHFGKEKEASYPYQVLLRLVEKRPGISKAKCALALEARNDSVEELTRILELADLSEEEARRKIGVSDSNWENAKKILPSLAEQVGDVIKTGQSYVLAATFKPGDNLPAEPAEPAEPRSRPRAPRIPRRVTADTIGKAGTSDDFDESGAPPVYDPLAAAEAIATRLKRLRRHNLMLQALARRFQVFEIYENPFDLLALGEKDNFIVEAKTLDGSPADERDRVRDALSQLLYYEAFDAAALAKQAYFHKIAFFEGPVTGAHREWLNRSGIAVIWQVGDGYRGDELARGIIGNYIEEL